MPGMVRHDGSRKLQILFPYHEDLVALVRQLSGRHWSPAGKYWSVPDESVVQVVELLKPHGFAFDYKTTQLYEAKKASRDGDKAAQAIGDTPASTLEQPPSELERAPSELERAPLELEQAASELEKSSPKLDPPAPGPKLDPAAPRHVPANPFAETVVATPEGAQPPPPQSDSAAAKPAASAVQPAPHLGDAVRAWATQGRPTPDARTLQEIITEERRLSPGDYTVGSLNARVNRALKKAFPSSLWLVGELSGFNKNQTKRIISFQLVERVEGVDEAKVDAVLFPEERKRILAQLEAAGNPFRLEDEIELRLKVRVNLYEPWGKYRVSVEDIDIGYTLGEAARRREEVLKTLKAEGIFSLNRTLPIPLLPLRVGLITSLGSDAYHDVCRTLEESGFSFQVTAHGARVQGPKTEASVLNALDWFRDNAHHFDLLMICRGGGSRTDLSWFDTLALGRAMARTPIPVVVGIGHEQDHSVLDALGRSCKTPTAAAEFVVSRIADFNDRIELSWAGIHRKGAEQVQAQKSRVADHGARLVRAVNSHMRQATTEMNHSKHRLLFGSRRVVAQDREKVDRVVSKLPRAVSVLLRRRRRDLDELPSRLKDLCGRITRYQKGRLEKTVPGLVRGSRRRVALEQHRNARVFPAIARHAARAVALERGRLLRLAPRLSAESERLMSQEHIRLERAVADIVGCAARRVAMEQTRVRDLHEALARESGRRVLIRGQRLQDLCAGITRSAGDYIADEGRRIQGGGAEIRQRARERVFSEGRRVEEGGANIARLGRAQVSAEGVRVRIIARVIAYASAQKVSETRGDLERVGPAVLRAGQDRISYEVLRIARVLPRMAKASGRLVGGESRRVIRLDRKLRDLPEVFLRRFVQQVQGQSERLGARTGRRIVYEQRQLEVLKGRLIEGATRRVYFDRRRIVSLMPNIVARAKAIFGAEAQSVEAAVALVKQQARSRLLRADRRVDICHRLVVACSKTTLILEQRKMASLSPRLFRIAARSLEKPAREMDHLSLQLENLAAMRISGAARSLQRVASGVDFLAGKELEAGRSNLEQLRRSIGDKAARIIHAKRLKPEEESLRIGHAAQAVIERAGRLVAERGRMIQKDAGLQCTESQNRLVGLSREVTRTATMKIKVQKARNKSNGRRLNSLDPFQVIARGYAMLYLPSGRLVKDSTDIPRGAAVNAVLSEGEMRLRSEGPTARTDDQGA